MAIDHLGLNVSIYKVHFVTDIYTHKKQTYLFTILNKLTKYFFF